MSLIFRIAEAKMEGLVNELETSPMADGKIYESVTLRNPLGLGLTTYLTREVSDEGSGPVRINANFSEFLSGSVHNEIYVEQDGAVVSEHEAQYPSPGILRRAKLLTRLVIGRPDHTFAELEFGGAFDHPDEC